MAQTFRGYAQESSPPWLLTAHGRPFMAALGDIKDGLFFRALEAVRARFPRHAAADGLTMLGIERQLPRGVDESNAHYAARLRKAWTIWQYAGTPLGMLTAFWTAGYVNVHLATANSRRHTMAEEGVVTTVILPAHSWLFRPVRFPHWNDFIVLFPEPLPQAWQDNGVPAENSDEADVIRAIVQRWRPAHMRCVEIAIATSSRTLDFYPAGETLDTRPGTLDTHSNWIHWAP